MARLVGPALAGMLIRSAAGLVLPVDGISYSAVIWSLVAMRLHAPWSTQDHFNANEWKAGGPMFPGSPVARFCCFRRGQPDGMPFVVLMPIFAKSVLTAAAYAGIPDGLDGAGRADLGLVAVARKNAGSGEDDPSPEPFSGWGLSAWGCRGTSGSR